MVPAGQPAPTFFGTYGKWDADAASHLEDVEWMRERWGARSWSRHQPADDARRAVRPEPPRSRCPTTGQQPDGITAASGCWPAIAESVGSQIEVRLADGGVRRGGVRDQGAALGARAVMIGRAYLWGWPPTARPGGERARTSCATGSTRRWLGLGTPPSTT
ncbi:alpha-hydroxy-acid oxidizing protein [Nonomuraea rubra]|uniref:alpha-hydroxy-acid oxidizing protein n=1 Tax=Nonomuraea rubra TaxID=46180 RepID=UPI0031E64912